MGDEQHRHVEPIAEIAQQAKDLDLDRDVERRGRFVGDQDLRPAGERDGDHDPLAHAARQLVRIGRQLQRGIRDPHHLEQLARPRQRGRAGHAIVDADGFRDLIAERQDRIERGHRLLENHRDAGHDRPRRAATAATR